MRQILSAVATVLAAVSAIGLAAGCKSGDKGAKEPEIKNVRTTEVQSSGETRTVSYPGRIQAAKDVNLSFRVAGPIAAIHFREGQHVQKGDTLAEIEERDYAIQLEATKAKYEQVKAEAGRVIELADRGSAAQNDYDKARYGLDQVTALYHAHTNALNDTKMKAPFDGWVQQVLFEAGETVGAGMPVISMISDGAPTVKVDIPSADFANIDRAARYWCTVDVFPGMTFRLSLADITKKANLNQLFTARFNLKPAAGGTCPNPGMSANVFIEYNTGEGNGTVIPAKAMFESDSMSCVWVVGKDNTIEKRQITPADIDRNGNLSVISGLTAGETVVTAGVHSLKEGETVRILPETSPSNIGNLL